MVAKFAKFKTIRLLWNLKLFLNLIVYFLDEDGKSSCRQNYSKECEAAVNEQINLEMHSSYVFLSMSCHKYDDVIVYDVTVPGLNEFLLNQSDVSVLHAQMLMQYQRDRGGHVVLHDIKKPERDSWGTGLEACEAALAMAKQINGTLLDLRRVAEKNGDSHMMDFINDSLLQKQAESINALSGFVTKLKRVTKGTW